MSSVDAAILKLACRWLPYGGPPAEEILIGFGMSPLRYEQRLLELLDSVASRSLSVAERTTLRAKLAAKRDGRPCSPQRVLSEAIH
ncbi:DUF3263 domain-containing protein [Rhodococcus sp. T7]|uniref:DUF3263 domain-containing protein n=1 Tax=Rhodococcus sp. T7 TaxID=627444 RepID=UPI00135C394E